SASATISSPASVPYPRPSARRGAACGLGGYALHLLHQFRQLGAEAGGLGFVIMHDGVFKQRIQPLDFLNRFVSLWHRHNQSSHIFQPIVYQTYGRHDAKNDRGKTAAIPPD
ncbi:MAG: hypothetical protein IKV56_01390, partial [Kiritimatiellae bacterium]|nr:hypothetical protein [Kiritimatiellia bacterium]